MESLLLLSRSRQLASHLLHKRPLLLRQAGAFQQIRPPLCRPDQGLLPPPCLDIRMVAGQKHLRHLSAQKILRPRILRIFQQVIGKRLELGGNLIVQNPRNK